MIDYDDPMWTEVVQRITVRISELTERLTSELPEFETSRIRGSVRALREVLDWPKNDAAKAGRPLPEMNFGIP